eukprot:15199223-Alexandrium_andersonii.AAC.1
MPDARLHVRQLEHRTLATWSRCLQTLCADRRLQAVIGGSRRVQASSGLPGVNELPGCGLF